MPDLQTEMSKKVLPNLINLKFDDVVESENIEVEVEKTTDAPLTRQLFDYIKEHPKRRGKVVLDEFEARGFKRTVIAATITALIKHRRVVRQGGKLTALQETYDKPKVSRVTKATGKKIKPVKIHTSKDIDTAEILKGLTIMQGRALYDKLKEIYGG